MASEQLQLCIASTQWRWAEGRCGSSSESGRSGVPQFHWSTAGLVCGHLGGARTSKKAAIIPASRPKISSNASAPRWAQLSLQPPSARPPGLHKGLRAGDRSSLPALVRVSGPVQPGQKNRPSSSISVCHLGAAARARRLARARLAPIPRGVCGLIELPTAPDARRAAAPTARPSSGH